MSVGKIILKSTTKMSLNERFTELRRNRPSQGQEGNSGLEERRQVLKASRKNQRLAEQMEHRPSVKLALRGKRPLQQRLNGQQSNVKQRLGIQERLTIPANITRGSFRGRFLRGARGPSRGRGRGGRGGQNLRFQRGGGQGVRGSTRGGGPFRGRGRGRGGRGRGTFYRTFRNTDQ